MSKNNEQLSLNKTIKIHGVEIKKMPCGKYFEALQYLKDLPEDFVKELSNNDRDFKLSNMFNLENILDLVTKLLIIAPKFLFRFLSVLLDVGIEKIKDELSPVELLEVCQSFWEVNNLESFFAQVKPMTANIMKIGFKKQLQSALKSE